jgi:hypothetical protein
MPPESGKHLLACQGISKCDSPDSPVVSVDGSTPNRSAIIVDCWGGSQYVREREDGRWQLASGDGPVAEFVAA